MLGFDASWFYSEYNNISNITGSIEKAAELCNDTCLASLIAIFIVFIVYSYCSSNIIKLIIHCFLYIISYFSINDLIVLVIYLFAKPISWLYQHLSNPYIPISIFISVLLTILFCSLFSIVNKIYEWIKTILFIST